MFHQLTLALGLPVLIEDTKARLINISKSPTGITDPFDSIYKIVYQLTMRTVGCDNIANDPVLLEKSLGLFQAIETSATPASIIFPWLPTPDITAAISTGSRIIRQTERWVGSRFDFRCDLWRTWCSGWDLLWAETFASEWISPLRA